MKRIIVLLLAAVLMTAVTVNAATLFGDANGDGKVNNKDVTTLFRYISGINIECITENCDVNGDKAVDNKDAVVLFRRLSGKTSADTDLSGMSHNENEKEDSGIFSELFG